MMPLLLPSDCINNNKMLEIQIARKDMTILWDWANDTPRNRDQSNSSASITSTTGSSRKNASTSNGTWSRRRHTGSSERGKTNAREGALIQSSGSTTMLLGLGQTEEE